MNGIGEKIRKIRNIRGYSQEYMGTRLHMSQNNYSRIELDQINLTLKTLNDIAGVLEISSQDILNFHEGRIFPSVAPREAEAQAPRPYGQNALVSVLQEEISSLREDRKRLILLLERNNARI